MAFVGSSGWSNFYSTAGCGSARGFLSCWRGSWTIFTCRRACYKRKKLEVSAALPTCCSSASCFNKLLWGWMARSEEHTSELQSRENLVCRLLLEKKNDNERNIGIGPRAEQETK